MAGLTPYLTPAMLLSTSYGISWKTFPTQGASAPDQLAAQLDICAAVTSTMDTLANQTLRANLDIEQVFGPDFVITILPNGWVRFRLSHWPILQLVSARWSSAGNAPPTWSNIPVAGMITEHAGLPTYGTTVPAGAGPGPTAALIPPGYIDWSNGRKGYLVQITSVNGFPVAGIDMDAVAGATTIHVDDITGWYNSTLGQGARGTIFDPPWRETVTVAGATPDTAGVMQGPGTLTLTSGLQFEHSPSIDQTMEANQTILLSAMPQALIQAGFYLATHFGLIRGATAAVQQSSRGQVTTSGMAGAMDWYARAEKIIERYGRVF